MPRKPELSAGLMGPRGPNADFTFLPIFIGFIFLVDVVARLSFILLLAVVFLASLTALLASSGRRGGLMVSVLDSGASGPGSSPGRGHCVVFLGKTLNSHSASLHPGVQMGTGEFNPLTLVPAVTGHAKTHPQFPVPAVKKHVRTIAFPSLPEDILVLLLFYCC